MKTINDLVDKLNSYGAYGEYYIKEGKNDNYLLYKRYILSEDSTLFEFAKKPPYWSIYPNLGAMHNQVQEDIMDFIYTTDKDHWFDEPEKKYNIVIGEDVNSDNNVHYKTAYRKFGNGVAINDVVREEDFINDEFIFTENEIEELKSNLPANMAKIVDLGKVEVKDD